MKIIVKLKAYDIDPFKGVANWFVKGGASFEHMMRVIGPMGRKEAEQWCADRGYTVVKDKPALGYMPEGGPFKAIDTD